MESPVAQALASVFQRTKEDGSPYYSARDLGHWMPMAIIASGLPDTMWSPEMHIAMSELLAKANIDLNHDFGPPLAQKLFAYYDANPGNTEIAAGLSPLIAKMKSDDQAELAQRAAVALRSARQPMTAPKSAKAVTKTGR